MEVTFLGFVSIAITIVFLYKRNRMLFLYTAVAFSGFSGSSVLNVAGVSIQPSYYFFIVYFIVEITHVIKKGTIDIRISKALLFFLIYCLVSLVFPIILKNRDIVLMNQDGYYVTLKFTSSNITQFIYLLFCLVFLNTLLKIQDESQKDNLLLSFKIGYFAVVLVCIYQVIAFTFGLEFDYYFRQGVHGNIQGERLYGPCIEASMLCYYLLSGGLLLLLQGKKTYKDVCLVIAGAIIGIASYSSTFIVGIIASIILFLLSRVKSTITTTQRRILLYMLLGIVAIFMLYIFREPIVYAYEQLIDKLNGASFSGAERLTSFFRMAQIGIQYPLGVGWGSSRSKDLLSTWLCNIGVVGVAIFLFFLIDYMRFCNRNGTLRNTYPVIVTFILMFVSVPEPYNLFIWFYVWYGYNSFGMKTGEIEELAHDKKGSSGNFGRKTQ